MKAHLILLCSVLSLEVSLSAPVGLTTEYREDPVGIDAARPRLSWRLPCGSAAQAAYEIECDGVPAGRVKSDAQLNVAWPGRRLGTGERHAWRVRTFDASGAASGWSRAATFTTGVMEPADWTAKWIGPDASTRPDEDMGEAQWITAPAGKKGYVSLVTTIDFSGASGGEFVEMIHLGVARHEIFVNGRVFHQWSGHANDWRFARFRNLTPYLTNGVNRIDVHVFADRDVPGEPVPHLRVPAPKDALAFLAKITFPNGRVRVTDSTWTSPDGAVRALGRVRDTAWGRAAILRTETASPAFAKTFAVRKPVASAVLHVTGVGFYEASLNGRKIGRKVLDPSPTAFDRRVLYSTYRLDGRLRTGENELKILVGHGWYDLRAVATWNFETAPWRDFPRAIAQLDITYADGTRERVATDASWRQVESPVGFDDIREGEVVGGSRALPNLSAAEVPAPRGRLVAEAHPGAEVMREIRPRAIHPLADGAYMIEFPCDLSGWMRLKMRGLKKGDVVSFRYDERANADFTPALPSAHNGLDDVGFAHDRRTDGNASERRRIDQHFRYPGSHRVTPVDAAFQTDRFISSGAAEETYEPRFTYNGFRFVLVRGLAAAPRPEDAVACFVHTAFPTTGSFDCSDATFNRLMLMNDTAYRCNFADGYPTDCPHREKNGWTGDANIAVELAQYVYENTSAYEKWVRDIFDAQLPDGNIPGIVPTSGWGFHWGNGPFWDAALTIVPWTLYLYRGDRAILDEAYPSIVRYLAYTATKENEKGLVKHGLGDWVPVNRKHMPSTEYTSSATYRQMLLTAASIAELKGLGDEASAYRARAERIRAALRSTYRKAGGVWENGLQTAQAVALAYGLVEPDEVPAVRARLVEAVREADDHVDMGLIGTKHVFRELSEAERTDLAFKMLTNPTSPSPAQWMRAGGSALWEDWGVGSSRCHIMFGDFAAWAYQYLAGIRLRPEAGSSSAIVRSAPGFRAIRLAPQPIAALDWVKASVETPYGAVRSAWRRTPAGIGYVFEVPTGATAEVILPGEAPRTLGGGVWEFSR